MDEQIPLIVQKYISEVAQKYSKKPIQVKLKHESKLMKAIGWFFKITKINPNFMTDYITTIGNTIHFPEELLKTMSPVSVLEIVVHECVHIKDSNRLGPLYILGYLGPQIFALLSIFALLALFAGKLWLLSLLFILLLAPIPSFGRFYFERRAYRTSFVFGKTYYKYNEEQFAEIRNWIVTQLTKNFYYFAWPFPKWMDNNLKNMDFVETEEYKEISTFITKNLLGERP